MGCSNSNMKTKTEEKNTKRLKATMTIKELKNKKNNNQIKTTPTLEEINVKIKENNEFQTKNQSIFFTDENNIFNYVFHKQSVEPSNAKPNLHSETSTESHERVKVIKKSILSSFNPFVKGVCKYLQKEHLSNVKLEAINQSALGMKVYFKQQTPLPSTSQPSTKFIDDTFPPHIDSILGLFNKKKVDVNNKRFTRSVSRLEVPTKEIIWLRFDEIFSKGMYSIFEGKIEVDDVVQGNIGNCYFLSSLAAMCEYPQLIIQIFRTMKVNPNGYYEIILNLSGQWTVVIVDDYIPCFKKTRKPVFSQSNNNEVWVLLLEKAWAKVNGGYVNIIGGYPNEVLSAMTPFGIKSYISNEFTDNKEELWRKIYNADRKEYIIVCGSSSNSNYLKNGILANHAFTIISAHEGVVKNNKIRLLRIRNPLGDYEWTGAWSDGSSEWDEESKIQFNEYKNRNDGTFFIEFNDYIQNFDLTQICIVRNISCSKSIRLTKESIFKGHIYKLKIGKYSHVDISVIKKSYRYNRLLETEIDFTINIILIQVLPNRKFKFIDSDVSNTNNPVLSRMLDIGDYIIYILGNQNNNYIHEDSLVLDIISDSFFSVLDLESDSSFAVLYNILKSKIESEFDFDIEKESDDEKDKQLSILNLNKIHNSSSIGVFYIKNKSNSIELNIKIEDKSVNYRVLNMIKVNKPEKHKVGHDFNKITSKNSTHFDEHFVNLKPNEDYLIIGYRYDYFAEYMFNIIYKIIPENGGSVQLNSVNPVNSQGNSLFESQFGFIFNDNKEIVYDLNYYNFIFKRSEVNLSEHIEKIDIKVNNEEHFKCKYPDFVKLISTYYPQSGKKCFFNDIHDLGYGIYFGEWEETNGEHVKSGRGITIFSDGSKHLGYYSNNEFNGDGEFLFKDGRKIVINFKNGKMNGLGKMYLKDKTEEYSECCFENGIQIKENIKK